MFASVLAKGMPTSASPNSLIFLPARIAGKAAEDASNCFKRNDPFAVCRIKCRFVVYFASVTENGQVHVALRQAVTVQALASRIPCRVK